MDKTEPNRGAGQPAPGFSQPPAGSGPPGGYQPSGGGAYQPPGGYQQAPPPPPPPKKGFNWLVCCGITCVVLLIVGGLVGYCGYRFMQPFIGMGLQLAALNNEVEQTDLQTIQASATSVSATELAADAKSYQGQWLELAGTVDNTSAFGSSSVSSGQFNTENTTNYMLEHGIIVMDITHSPPVGGQGDTIIAYGKSYSWDLMDMEKMPFIGKAITEEMKKDPELQGATQIVFFVAKQVSRSSVSNAPVGEGEAPAGEGEAPADSGAAAAGWD